ncbi:MAG: M43 family zinc metalloprotease, partial [Flavobacteriales bacterium]
GINRIPNELISVNYNLDEACGDYMTRQHLHDLGEWTTQNYLNIYIVDGITTTSCEQILANPNLNSSLFGFASPPWVANEIDGIIIRGDAFGVTGQASQTNALVLPHELGHYLGLYHLSGPFIPGPGLCDLYEFTNCEETVDRVCDTPILEAEFFGGCAADFGNLSTTPVGCSGYEWDENPFTHPINNIMHFANIGCPHHFTVGQKNRMRCYLNQYQRWALWQDWNLIERGLGPCILNPVAELGCNGEEIQIIYSADFEPDYQYEWTFGGEITSDLHEGEITLDEIGDGLITLTVTDECSSVEVYSIHTDDLLEELSIQIEQVSCYEFNLSVPECLVNSWNILWYLGDGTGGQGANVNHVYCPSIDPYEGFAAF